MSGPEMPNPIELYEGAVQYMIPIISGIRAEQMGNQTPCSEWNVQALLNHNIKVAEFAHSVLVGTRLRDPTSTLQVDGPLPCEGAVDAFVANTNKVLDVIKAAGGLDKVVGTGFGPAPARHFLMFPLTDIVIHKWDLAKATGQDTSLDGSLADACYNTLTQVVEGGRQGGFFGPEVEVLIDAAIQEKLLALSGRRP